MNRWTGLAALLMTVACAAAPPLAHGEGQGQSDLDEALRQKVTAEDLRDLNKVIELLESAIDKGLDVENSDFAETMLVESLMNRAAQLAAVVQSVPLENLAEPRLQRVRDLAVTDLRRVVEYDTAPPQAKLLLAQLLAMPGGDPEDALELLNEALADEDAQLLPPNMRAESLTLRATLQDDPDKAQADYEAAIALEPDEIQHRLARAEFYRQQEKLDEAIADIDQVIEGHPDAAAAYLMKAQILREQEKLDEAIASLDQATERAPTAPSPYQQRGEIYRLQGDFDKAVQQFNRVLQLQPGMVLTLIHRAEAYLNLKRYDEALVDIEAVLKDNPDLTVAHGIKAQALASLERMPEAIEEMKRLAEAEPDQADYRAQLAMYYLFNKQPQEAIAEYGKVLEQDPDNFMALRGRADAYLNIGDHAAAVKDFEAALKIDSDDTGLLNNYAWVLATSPDDDVRDGQRAVELATKACEEVDYKQAHILSTLAAAYAETGDFEKAREWSQKAVEQDEDEHEEQLKKELESYQANKPWRERQTLESLPAAEDKPPQSEPKESPATAEAR